MKNPKIIFDTSVISSLFDNSSNTAVVVRLFDFLKNNKRFDLFVSPIFYNEISNGSTILIKKVSQLVQNFNIASLPYSIDATKLTEQYLNKVLTENHYRDLAHIAYAGVFACHYLISCDRKHIAKQRTIDLVKTINSRQNVFVPNIVTPLKFLTLHQ
jgi:predicted nucleic acid-binding protein